jgi:FtsP/CotA-like multicopper oxidase with cupredoxin domain
MTIHTSTVDLNRRLTLSWGFGLSLGLALAPLAGCGGDTDDTSTQDTLPEAPVLTSVDGALSLTLTAQYAAQTLSISSTQDASVYPGIAKNTATALRSFNGQYMAPTLVLNVGDTLRIGLNNQLPPSKNQSALSYLNHQNSTNLHFHGLHVDPKEIRPGVFGDYVVDLPNAGVSPGASRQHELAIPADHTNGVYWYHPHLHGSSNVQVSSGMFGAILIKDPKDTFAKKTYIRERVIFVHKVTLNAEGKTESFYDSITNDFSGFLLNGAHQPTIVMRPGEVQNWHFINSNSFFPFNPVLDEHTLWLYAKDGNVLNQQFQALNTATSTQFDDQNWPGNAVYPGGRLSVLIKASDTPGTYYLRAVRAPAVKPDPPDEIVARIVVEGASAQTVLPTAQELPKYASHQAITDEELATHGGKQRYLVLSVLSRTDPLLAPNIPAGEEWFIPLGDGADKAANTVFATGEVGSSVGMTPFQSSLTPTQTVALNAVEEWTIQNMNNYPHPFHIHVNDSYVTKINGQPIKPFWADTLPLPPKGSLTFRMRFTDFSGPYVWHCHALNHEDLGMMQLVEVVA